jgi:hypothetical protein
VNDNIDDRVVSRNFVPAICHVALVAWFLIVCFVSDTRTFTISTTLVDLIVRLTSLSDTSARLAIVIVLRLLTFLIFGLLISQLVRFKSSLLAILIATLLAVCVTIASQLINHRDFPSSVDVQLGVFGAITATLIGFALRRSWLAFIGLVVFTVGTIGWSVWIRVPATLESAARIIGAQILADAANYTDGDEGFNQIIRDAFLIAEDNSHGTDAIMPNQAAILAIGVVLGDERVAALARRKIELDSVDQMNALRSRITLGGRHDLARHFSVSAALTVLMDRNRAIAIGVGKEVKDSMPGGSGYSFVDMLANRSGIQFTSLATQDAQSARSIQDLFEASAPPTQLIPSYDDLPEGIDHENFQKEYGGISGQRTLELDRKIQTKLDALSQSFTMN